MCQLSFINTHNAKINSLMALFLASHNSIQNPDGFGIFVNGKIYKTDSPGYLVTNVKQLATTDKPVMIHVRKASYKKDAKLEGKSHPFCFGSYILMHNGTLEPKSDKIPDKMIDSEFFTLKLSENGNETVSSLKQTMNNFMGKFAFLIYNKNEDKYYAVRGKTADLNYVGIVFNGVTGYIINTERDTLIRALIMLQNFYPDIELTEITELEKESIFVLEDTQITKIDSIKENEKPVVINIDYRNWKGGRQWYYDDYWNKDDEELQELVTLLVKNNYARIEDFLFWFFDETGVSPFSVEIGDIKAFLKSCSCS